MVSSTLSFKVILILEKPVFVQAEVGYIFYINENIMVESSCRDKISFFKIVNC